MHSIWQLQSYNDETALQLSRELKISLPTARLLVQRGNQDAETAREFLYPQLSRLEDPLKMKGMQAAIERIAAAMAAQEKIVIYGDYDADGVCSIVILMECFQQLNYSVDYYVPDRFSEGYGLHAQALQLLSAQGYKLIITVDCGIASLTEADLAYELGMDLIITDHHTPADTLPQAAAIINPKIDQREVSQYLAGVGVSYKLAYALLRSRGFNPRQRWLDLVAIATIADIVPLLGENRILVKHGLTALKNTSRPGLKALMDITALNDKPINTWQIGFVLAPRLNSAGRLDSARKSVDLLLSRDEQQALLLAEELCRLNDERREIEEDIFQQALLELGDGEQYRFILACGENWHEGVIGIVASRLANKFNRPAIVVSWEGDQGQASARSSGDFDLYAALHYCRHHLVRFGGHRMAAGLGLRREQLEDFRQALQDYMLGRELPDIGKKIYTADLEIEENELSLPLWNEFELLAPFGEGNPVPNLILRSSALHDLLLVGSNRSHLKFKAGANYLEAIAFNAAERMHPGLKVCKQDLLFDMAENTFRGRSSLQLKIRDLKPAWRDDRLGGEELLAEQMRPVLKTIVEELANGQAVLFVYPTGRSLKKHRALLQAIVKPELLQEMHGLLDKNTQKKVLQQLSHGDAKIYLSTQSFLEYVRSPQNYLNWAWKLPPNLKTVVNFWSTLEESSTLLPEYDLNRFTIKLNYSRVLQKNLGQEKPDERRITYVNRSSSVKDLLEQYPQAQVEAGSTDPRLRRQIRQRFRDSRAGILLADGTHPPGAGQLGEIDKFILYDSPFADCELAAIIDYIDNRDLPLQVAFSAEDIQRNSYYLQRIYPESDKLAQIWLALLSYGGNSIRRGESEILKRLSQALNSKISSLELTSALRILSDLGLCQFQKSGSIMAIYFYSTQKNILSPDLSPYFCEGKKEKEQLQHWFTITEKYIGMVM